MSNPDIKPGVYYHVETLEMVEILYVFGHRVMVNCDGDETYIENFIPRCWRYLTKV